LNGRLITVVSAFGLSAAEKSKLEAACAKRFGGGFAYRFTTDEKLIGGIRIEKDDEILDATIQGRLAKLRGAAGR
jgi:F-type H+-transporting ATPase subunit delta